MEVKEYGIVTEEALAKLRSKIGKEMKINYAPYVTEINKDAIKTWAEGIGDLNPLWTDKEYAEKTKWGGLIAPPTILYATDRLSIGYRGGLPGVHSFFAGSNWDFRLPIKVGSKIDVKIVFKDIIEHKSKFGGRSFQEISTVTFTNEKNEVVATADSWGMRIERKAAQEKDKYKKEKVEPKVYTKEEIQEIMSLYEREYIRGADKLYWEDVEIGQEVPSIIRGPYTLTCVVAFEQAWGGIFVRAHGHWYKWLKKHPAGGLFNELGIPEPPEAVHYDKSIANKAGIPDCYDYGPERIAWIGSMLTNWIGDDGFLKKLNVQVRRHNMLGDLTTCKGKVINKSILNNEHQVECEVNCVNQDGYVTAKGTVVVILPSKG